jgi:hypothetical protein
MPNKYMTQLPKYDRPISSLLVNPRDYETVKQLGKGASGCVYLVKSRSGSLYALKQVKISHANLQQQQYLLREIETMALATHPCLLQLLGFSLPASRDGMSAIITDFMPRGSLLDLLEQEKAGRKAADWDLTHKICLLIGLAGGIRYLHGRRIMHRDLKADNVLLTETLEPRIADFGLSKLTLPDDPKAIQMTGKIGTPLYMAPELFDGQDYDFKVDVYAFAVLVYEVLSGKTPFADVPNPMQLAGKVLKGVRPGIPESVPGAWAGLIERCWGQDPAGRPTFEEIVGELMGDEFIVDGCDKEVVIAWRDKVFADGGAGAEKTVEVLQIGEVRKLVTGGLDGVRAIVRQMQTDVAFMKEATAAMREGIGASRSKMQEQERTLEAFGRNLQATAADIRVFQDKQKQITEDTKAKLETLLRQLAEVRGRTGVPAKSVPKGTP